jgi:hypothetical protein
MLARLMVSYLCSTPHVLVDRSQRIITVLAGRPTDAGWDGVMREATRLMDEVRRKGHRSQAFEWHRRGSFTAFGDGVSFGGGQRVRAGQNGLFPAQTNWGGQMPGNLVHTKRVRDLLRRLKQSRHIIRIAGFQSSMSADFFACHCAYSSPGCLAFYAPKIYEEYNEKLSKLYDRYPGLQQNFSNSILPGVTFNLGPDTACIPHFDNSNVAHGFCAVTSGGDYNPTTGGHIVLHALKLIVEFPPGSTILIPSATLCHSNTPVKPGETRYSMTQYCAGGLLRWVNYGFRSMKSLLAEKGGREKINKIDGLGDARLKWALSLFSKATELEADRRKVFNLV